MWKCENVKNVKMHHSTLTAVSATASMTGSFHLPHFHISIFITFSL